MSCLHDHRARRTSMPSIVPMQAGREAIDRAGEESEEGMLAFPEHRGERAAIRLSREEAREHLLRPLLGDGGADGERGDATIDRRQLHGAEHVTLEQYAKLHRRRRDVDAEI